MKAELQTKYSLPMAFKGSGRREQRLQAATRHKGICLVLAILLPLMPGRTPHAEQETDVDDFQARIQAIGTEDNPEKVHALVAEVEAAGKASKDANYYHKLVELCSALLFSEGLDPARGVIARSLARDAFNSPGEKPLFAEVELIVFLQADFDFIGGLEGGDQWRQERLRRLGRWVAAWQLVQGAKTSLPKPSGIILFGHPLGEPQIDDPVLRKHREDVRKQSSENIRLSRQRSELDYLERNLVFAVRFYTVSPYSRPPFDSEELEKTLAGSGLDKKLQADLVGEVKKKEAAWIAHEKTLHEDPPTMRFIEIPPPGTAVYHSDLRFRKLVSFQVSLPLVEDILGKLREGTGVSLTRANDIQNEYPAAGSLFYMGIPAWKVMDRVAESKYVQGRWEKDGDGYRLVRNGNPVAPPEINEFAQAPPSPGWQGAARVVAVVVTVTIIGVLCFLMIRRKRLATT
jgi:hypothetical protein